MSGLCFLSTTVEITFLYLEKLIKKQLNFSNSIFCSVWKTEQLFIISTFHHLSFPKVLYKSVLLSVIKVPYKSILLFIITYRHLSLTYHTQKYFIKAFYYLTKTWLKLNVRKLTLLIIPKSLFLSVFYFDMWNKQMKDWTNTKTTNTL